MKRVLTIILPILLCIIAAVLLLLLREPQFKGSLNDHMEFETPTMVEQTQEETIIETTTDNTLHIKLSFVGDLLCATDARTSYENCFEDVAAVRDPSYFLSEVNSYFLKDDFTIGDAENVYSDDDTLSMSDKGQFADPNIEAYWFKTKSKNAKILSVGGIDMVSIDNNHINDYGAKGHQDTKDALDKAKVLWGEEGKVVYYEKENFKIAVICVSMYNDGVLEKIKGYVKEASKNSDYQIIYFHGGTEAVHTPETWKVNACHALIDAGADMVIGDHPHVLQRKEVYKGSTIIYSMGNFVFGGNRHPENRTIIYQHTLTCFSIIKIFLEQPIRLPQFPPFQRLHALPFHVHISVSYRYGSKHVSCVCVLPLFVVLVSTPAWEHPAYPHI